VQRGACFFYRARRAADAAHLVIVNHALLLADVAVQNRALPDYRFLIVDEAHNLEAAITGGLSFAADRPAIKRLLDEAGRRRDGRASGLLGQVLSRCQTARLDRQALEPVEGFVEQITLAVERAQNGLEGFVENLQQLTQEDQGEKNTNPAYARQTRVTSAQRIQPSWDQVEITWDEVATPLWAVADGLERLAGGLEDLAAGGLKNTADLQAELLGVARRLGEIHHHINAFVSQPDPGAIYWLQIGPNQAPLSIHAAPLHVGPLVQEHLLHKKEVVILTSATLRTGGAFDFLRERLHAWDMDELAVGSPFDYKSSTLVYLVEDIPEPNQPGYQRAVEQGLIALFRATSGRALGLFTSYSQLRTTAQAITAPLERADVAVYAQRQGLSRNQLLENFRRAERGVLLGTRSFWEGIDVPGEALSCLVIVKLPFNVPSDPVFAARSETFDTPFMEYAVPEAVLRFLQGFGRLIRTRTDRGVVAIFDRRLISKSYGQVFLDSLPDPTIRRGPVTLLPKAAAEWLGSESANRRISE